MQKGQKTKRRNLKPNIQLYHKSKQEGQPKSLSQKSHSKIDLVKNLVSKIDSSQEKSAYAIFNLWNVEESPYLHATKMFIYKMQNELLLQY